jgi:hypothetical protein
MGKQVTRAREVLTGFLAFVLSAILGLGFAVLVNKTHDFLAGRGIETQTLVGTWQGTWHDVPAVTMTIDRQGEQLTGFMVFQAVLKTSEGPQSAGNPITVPLKEATFDGKTLRFKLEDQRAARDFTGARIEMTLTSANQAQLKVAANNDSSACQEVKMTKTAWSS